MLTLRQHLSFYYLLPSSDTLQEKRLTRANVKNQPAGSRNLMCVLRRRLGLSQEELAQVIGYEGRSHICRLENGSRTPHLAEVLIIELVFGVPAVTIFPQIRQVVGGGISKRLKRLIAELEGCSTHARRSYKTAQLERVLASLRTRDDFDQSGPEVWQA